MGAGRENQPHDWGKWWAAAFAIMLLGFSSFSPVAYSGDCMGLCEGGKQNCLSGCAAGTNPSKVAACNTACTSTYNCPVHCANQKQPGGTTQSAPPSAASQCMSSCNQQFSQCFTNCKGDSACYKICTNSAKSCNSACSGISSSTTSSPSQGQSNTQDILNKVDNLNKAVQGIFGAGE